MTDLPGRGLRRARRARGDLDARASDLRALIGRPSTTLRAAVAAALGR